MIINDIIFITAPFFEIPNRIVNEIQSLENISVKFTYKFYEEIREKVICTINIFLNYIDMFPIDMYRLIAGKIIHKPVSYICNKIIELQSIKPPDCELLLKFIKPFENYENVLRKTDDNIEKTVR